MQHMGPGGRLSLPRMVEHDKAVLRRRRSGAACSHTEQILFSRSAALAGLDGPVTLYARAGRALMATSLLCS